jgi:hypothetical protein
MRRSVHPCHGVVGYLAVGDYDGLVSTYHWDAVLVGERTGTRYPITQALARWNSWIQATKADMAMSRVEFHITRRLYGSILRQQQSDLIGVAGHVSFCPQPLRAADRRPDSSAVWPRGYVIWF